MRIREIRCAGLRGATPEGGWDEELQADDCVHTLVLVVTEEGLTGLGSAFTSEALVKGALDLVWPLLRGENALEPERVAEKLHQHTFWTGRGGSVTHAISAVDIAMWDILGKAVGQPVGRLLGGRYRETVMPYASVLMDYPDRMADVLLPLRDQGYRAIKMGWGPFGREDKGLDERIVCESRSLVGDDCLLMVDAGASDAFWTRGYKWALRTARMLADYDVGWFEEPLVPDAMADFEQLRVHAPLPIAGGEVLTRRQTFKPWLDRGCFDIVQPDVTKVGGISESRRIGRMAEDAGVRYIPHGWNTACGLAADLHLASAFPGTDLVEYIAGSAYVDELRAGAWHLDANGHLAIPDSPGLGLELDPDAVAHYTGQRDFLSP